ncbi:MAG TPA: Gfo/Idh/MocA family oxidoreductase [Lacunisphaera sp.]|nr:Gfo/Idh/MocA family oxidoreductase [Lacunisphaera sp.]
MNPLRLLPLFVISLLAGPALADDLRIGLIGLDTSHAVVFTRLLNDPKNPDHVPGGRIVAAYKAGSPDIANSVSRIEGFVAELKKDPGIVFYDSIPELVRNVDAVMIVSVDGRPHLEQAKQVFPSKKPLFVDKPAAGTLRDTIELFRLARESGTPCYSVSSLRANAKAALANAKFGELRGAFTYGPAELEPHHPDLFWYGIHSVETLFTLMGPGCQTVVRTQTGNAEVATGVWADGRVGTMRGTRDARSIYGFTVFGSQAVVTPELGRGYNLLLEEVIAFFKTGVPPVTAEETIEIFTFMEAADESKRRGGVPVTLAEVLKANTPSEKR